MTMTTPLPPPEPEHHAGTIHLTGGMPPEEFQRLVESGEINLQTGLGLDQHGISVGGSVELSGEGNPAEETA